MGWRCSTLIVLIILGMLFCLLYASSILPTPVQYHHEPDKIPTEPKVSQLQALEIAVKALKDNANQTDDSIKLWFSFYNFSKGDYERNPDNYRVGYKWPISSIREQPELLHLELVYFHPNRTAYLVNATDGSYRSCDWCGNPSDRMLNHLLWRIDLSVQPADVDAETGKIVNPIYDRLPFPPNVQVYQNISEARTVKQILQARLNPPETTHVYILRGAANNDTGKVGVFYEPRAGRAPLEISNKFLWINRDTVTHTVTSDNRYSNEFTGKFDSGMIQAGAAYEYTFMDEGEYSYHCSIHPWMKGRVEIIENFS